MNDNLYYRVRNFYKLSQKEMAEILGLLGQNGAKLVHEFETGQKLPTQTIHNFYTVLDFVHIDINEARLSLIGKDNCPND